MQEKKGRRSGSLLPFSSRILVPLTACTPARAYVYEPRGTGATLASFQLIWEKDKKGRGSGGKQLEEVGSSSFGRAGILDRAYASRCA